MRNLRSTEVAKWGKLVKYAGWLTMAFGLLDLILQLTWWGASPKVLISLCIMLVGTFGWQAGEVKSANWALTYMVSLICLLIGWLIWGVTDLSTATKARVKQQCLHSADQGKCDDFFNLYTIGMAIMLALMPCIFCSFRYRDVLKRAAQEQPLIIEDPSALMHHEPPVASFSIDDDDAAEPMDTIAPPPMHRDEVTSPPQQMWAEDDITGLSDEDDDTNEPLLEDEDDDVDDDHRHAD